MNSPVRLGVSPAASTPTGFFQSEVLRFYFLALEPWILGSILLPSCSSHLSAHKLGLPILPATTLPALKLLKLLPVLKLLPLRKSSPLWLPVSTSFTGLYECFFFNYLVVRLPYGWIFCQFWLFFVFKFVIVLVLVVQGSKVYLPMPPT